MNIVAYALCSNYSIQVGSTEYRFSSFHRMNLFFLRYLNISISKALKTVGPTKGIDRFHDVSSMTNFIRFVLFCFCIVCYKA